MQLTMCSNRRCYGVECIAKVSTNIKTSMCIVSNMNMPKKNVGEYPHHKHERSQQGENDGK